MRTKFRGILTLLLAFVVQLTFAQEKTITGKVVDENDLPVPGVNVFVKNTTSGTQTDFDGNYSITASSDQTLVFSYVGYKTNEILVGAKSTINVTLVPDVEQLEAVVVTALGVKRKKDEITSAYQVVESEDIVKANNPDVVNSLSGKVSGLNIKQTSNGVTGETRITLRGSRSITGNNEALIVIDGAISTANFLRTLNPNTIESLNVIKGPNGAALYGSQGANGVIIVTTKSGTKEEKMKVNFKSTADFTVVDYVPEHQTRYGQGWDLGQGFANIIYENGGWGPEFDGQPVRVGLPQADGSFITAPYSSRGADNIKDFFDTGITLQNSFDISSGDKNGYVFMSAQNEQTEFIINGDELKRSSFNFRAGKTLGKWEVGGNVTYTYTATEEANSRLYGELNQVATNIPIEAFKNSGNEGHWNGYFLNPYWIVNNDRSERDTNRFNILADLKYHLNDNITFVLRSNGIFTNRSGLNYNNGYTEPQSVIDITGNRRDEPSSFNRFNTSYQRYYDINEDLRLDGSVGLNNQYVKNSQTGVGGTGLTVPGIYTSENLSGNFDQAVTFDFQDQSRRYSVFGSVNLGFRDYLYLNATARNDWNSVFSDGNQSYFYPSVGLSFIPTEAFEDFGGDVLNYLKLSGSFVRVGNDGGVDPYDVNQVVNKGFGFPFNGLNSFEAPENITDPNLEPEFTEQFEFGLNAGFLKDRITLDVAYYNFTTDNLITGISTSSASGLSRSTINIGQTSGYGFEIDLGLVPVKSEDFRWNLNFGLSRSYTEVDKVSDQAREVALGGFTGFAQVFAIEGEQFPMLKTVNYLRDAQGRVILDSDGNPQQTSGPEISGNTTPDYVLNINTRFSYKNWTLAATMDYRTGHVFYSGTKRELLWSGHDVATAEGGRGAFIFPNSVIPDGNGGYVPNTNLPSGGTTAGSYISFWSSNMAGIAENSVLDATAFKLRELSLRYDFTENMLKDTFISSASISLIGRNILTILPEENRGYNDPESNFTATGNSQGISSTGQYPPTRSYGIGINVSF
jgi:TonB-linked SusC/RagA family outer membrane protein